MAGRVVYYREHNGTVPLIEWLRRLPSKAADKCFSRLIRLEQLGHELRRPEADYLTEGIYELRASYQGAHYRMLYFFHQQNAIVVSHGLVKERVVPPTDIDLARRRKRAFEADPEGRSWPMAT